MEQPLVSVIVPNYNHASYLDERMQSILNQTCQNFEVIILDDKSTDNSLDIIEKYRSNEHVSHIVVNEVNSGSPFKQWRKGIELAKGELIWIAESDDTCESIFLETMVNCFLNDTQMSYTFCRSTYMDEQGTLGNICQGMFPQDLKTTGREFNYRYMMWGNKVFNASSAVFKKENALSISQQYTTFQGAGDWLFWIELAELGNVSVIAQPLNHYRMYATNTTSQVRLAGVEDKEDFLIYQYFKSHGYMSWLDDIRLRKKYVWSIKYQNEYQNEEIRQKSLDLWRPNRLILLLALLSRLKQSMS